MKNRAGTLMEQPARGEGVLTILIHKAVWHVDRFARPTEGGEVAVVLGP